MAKRTSEASTPAPLTVTVNRAAVVDSPANTAGASRAAAVASKIDDSAAEVVEWGNGSPRSERVVAASDGDGEAAPASAAKPRVDREAETPRPTRTKEDAPDADKPAAEEEDAEPVAAAAGGKPIGADKRKQILEALDREKSRVDIETRIKDEQTKREQAEAKLAQFEKSPLGRKIKLIAEQHGLTVEDLKDKLLIGADDVLDKEPAAAPAEKVDPKVAELLKWKEDREKSEADARVTAAVESVRETLKDADLPLVETFGAYNRVMVMAHSAWKASGGEGTPYDFVPDAAALVEEKLKAEQPGAARRLYPQKTAADGEAEAEETPAPTPRAARPTMGKRTAARPGVKPVPLPDDPFERDNEIMRRNGWTRP